MKETIQDRIKRVAEKQHFGVYFSERYGDDHSQDVEFSGFTEYGQEIVFSAIMKEGDPLSLVEELKRGYDAYDPDYEASLWIDKDGHGKRGAPHHIADIVKDMEDAERQYGELYEAMLDEFADYDAEDD